MLKTGHPEIEKVHLHQDNARCYHSAGTVLACPSIEASTGVKVEGLDFSDPQVGKGAADRTGATAKPASGCTSTRATMSRMHIK